VAISIAFTLAQLLFVAPGLHLGLALAAAALFRPGDAVWLALPMAAATLGVPRWRRPALFAVLVAGLALGGAQWIVEAYLSYGAWPGGCTAPAPSRAASAGMSPSAIGCARWPAPALSYNR